MGVGHLAVGLASKRFAPNTSLGWLVLAPVFLDVLCGIFVMIGLERMRIVPGITKAMPLDLEYLGLSHSLVAVIGWSALLAGIYFARHKDRIGAVVIAIGVLSHFVLDWISHRPDMPILPDGPHVGLGLWNYPVAAITTELAMLAFGLWSYLRVTRAPPRGNSIALGALASVLAAINIAAYFGPPPPNVTAIAAGNLLLIGVVAVLHRIDASRELRVKR